MTEGELSRTEVCILITEKIINQQKAAEILNLSVRQVRRLYKNFKKKGASGLVSKKRGAPSNHKLPADIKSRLLELVTCEIYSGFGPPFSAKRSKSYTELKYLERQCVE